MWSRGIALAGLIGALLAGSGCDEPPPARAPGGELRLGAVLGETTLAGYARADGPRTFSFPEDHGPHPDFRSEWWYLTLSLDDDEGHPVGVQFTLFRQALAPPGGSEADPPGSTGNGWRTRHVYLAHFAVTDVAAGEHRAFERFARGHPRLAGVQAEPFRLWLEDWRIDGDGSTWRLHALAPEQSVDVTLRFTGEPVLQGAGGLSRKGPDHASYYYSVPRIDVAGRVHFDGHDRTVRGTGWLDREWSTSVLSSGQVGWDWFALALDDGRRVMLFQLRREDGSRDPFDQGMLSVPGRADRLLVAADFDLEPVRYWRDEQGTAWPVAWAVRLGEQTWQVEALLDDQKMETTIRYWEGLVRVEDRDGREVGRGYMELTGYGGTGRTTSTVPTERREQQEK